MERSHASRMMWQSIEECFGTLDNPRVQVRCDYSLVEIITIAICTIISGSETWTDGDVRKSFVKQSSSSCAYGNLMVSYGSNLKDC